MNSLKLRQNITIIIQKLFRRVNKLLPSFMRRQWVTALTYDKRYFHDPSYRYLTDLQVAEFSQVIMTLLEPKSVIDLGCGLAHYLVALKAKGVRVIGFDVSLYAVKNTDPSVPVFIMDIKKPFRSNQKFDIAICFEVAEHLPKNCAPVLIESLCTLSDTILFTAAQPTQPGIDHINLQLKSFWVALFNHNGLNIDEQLTQQFVECLNSINGPEWFSQNFSVFRKIADS